MSESLYVAVVSPVHKITFSEEFNPSLTIKSSLSPYGYTGSFKKSKSNGIANLLSNVFLIAFSWVVTVSAARSVVFAPIRAFKPLADCMPWSSLSSRFFFAQVKILVHVIDMWVVNCISVFWTKPEHLFLHQCPTHVVHNTTCFVCWLNGKVKGNFDSIWYNYMISWAMRYFNVSVFIWVCYIWPVGLGYMFSLAFERKLFSMFYHGI